MPFDLGRFVELRALGGRQHRKASQRDGRIVAALERAAGPKRRKDPAEASGGEGGSFDRALRKVEDAGRVAKDGDLWGLA
jgi:hypothetical protein